MKGDLHLMVDFFPKYPDMCHLLVEGYRETGELSYVGTPKMELQYRFKVKLRNGISQQIAFMKITKDCKVRVW